MLLVPTVAVDTHPVVLAYNAFQVVGIAGSYFSESKNPMPYSKFAVSSKKNDDGTSTTKMVPSRVGMLIIYVPATIVALAVQWFLLPLIKDSTPTVAGWLVFAHFVKRDLEVLFLHKYSGSTELDAARMIAFVYALTALMICFVSTPTTELASREVFSGVSLFVVGSLGNLYNHYLLAKLRSDSIKKYVAPRGGLFQFVAAPHYLFELLAWLGIAVASHQLTGYLNLLSMTMYLSARSQNQNNWNKNKFSEKEWPASRKNMVPFVY
ncbi:3-oxo-5-alpha-steroid 4-dehydrogenase-domain containing protein [Nitzschia inconspicua]|uniref:3-oxo-5-alpha-steroid 4-dehydrogenase-domain containing protein n=1 Tax=Nitzschia inconspicua TaxID=303405 RepID=A0A9K3LF50_9STRA|nr:3-oxo-5-alpha-steroid 4-dehydrogenase-domain containing protein [Nitzschia inconspicua]